MTNKISDEAKLYRWRVLYHLAHKIEKKNPWEILKKEQAIAISDPFTEKKYYCVFEHSGGYPMVKIYCTEESILNYLDLAENPLLIEGEKQIAGFHHQAKALDNMLFCLIYAQAYELDAQEKNLLEITEYPKEDETGRYPAFYRLQYAKKEEAIEDLRELMTLDRVLTQLWEIIKDDALCKMIQQNERGKERLFYRIHQNNTWQNEWLYIEKLRRSLPYFTFQNEFLQRKVAKLPQKEEGYCEMVRMYMPIPQWENELQSMHYPLYLMMVDLTDGIKTWQQNFIRDGEDENLAKEMTESLARTLLEKGYKPKGIILCDDFLRRVFQDFCEKTKIELIFTDEGILNMSLAKWEQMMKFQTAEQLDWARKGEQNYIFAEDKGPSKEISKEKESDSKTKEGKIVRLDEYMKKKE